MCVCVCVCIYIYTYTQRVEQRRRRSLAYSFVTPRRPVARNLAFTRYSFTSRLLCTNQPSFPSHRLPALPTLVQYYCTIIGQYTSPLPTSGLYAIHHTILVITISCKGQLATPAGCDPSRLGGRRHMCITLRRLGHPPQVHLRQAIGPWACPGLHGAAAALELPAAARAHPRVGSGRRYEAPSSGAPPP